MYLRDAAKDLNPVYLQMSACIFCSADCITVRQKTIHALYRVSEKLMAQSYSMQVYCSETVRRSGHKN